MNLKRILAVAMVLLLLPLSGCLSMDVGPDPTPLPPMTVEPLESVEQFHALYNQIEWTDTIASLREKFGAGTEETADLGDSTSTGINVSWTQDGITAIAAFKDGELVGKMVDAPDPRQLSPLTPGVDIAKAHEITKEMTYTDIVALMGCEGVEVLSRVDRTANPVTVDRLIRWADEGGNVLQILFAQDGTVSADDNSATLFEYPTLEPGATYYIEPTETPNPDAAVTAEAMEATEEPAA